MVENLGYCQAGTRSKFYVLFLAWVVWVPRVIYKQNPTSEALVTKNHKHGRDDWLRWIFHSQHHTEFCPSSELQVFPFCLNFFVWIFSLKLTFLWETLCKCLEEPFLGHVQSSAGDLELYGLALIFPLSGSIPGLKNRAPLFSGVILQASSGVCKRLHSLAEVCGSPGLTRGWGDICLCSDLPCTSNIATVRTWTMWKAWFSLWSLVSPPFLS